MQSEIFGYFSEDRKLIEKMTGYYTGDPKRIQHFMKVYAFSRYIGEQEELDERTYKNLCTAAIVHDIGIKSAEEKYGRGICGGDLQQKLGPEPAKKMLAELNYGQDRIERVCFLIAHHHTYTGIDGMDWQILLESDFLVNAFDDELSKESIVNFRNKVFKTRTGISLLNKIFALE